MKKILILILGLFICFNLVACSNSSTQTDVETENSISSDQSVGSESSGKILVAYYSATGNTKEIANDIAADTGATLFEIVPTEVYTEEDLDWTNSDSRVSREHEDESLQVVALENTTPENWSDYQTVFIGYPIWWGEAAWPIDGFVSNNDFSGKTVIPFCTSASSEIGQSGELLAEMAGTGNWQEGMRFQSGTSPEEVQNWVESLNL